MSEKSQQKKIVVLIASAVAVIGLGVGATYFWISSQKKAFDPKSVQLSFSMDGQQVNSGQVLPPVILDTEVHFVADVTAQDSAQPYVLRVQKNEDKKGWVTISSLESGPVSSSDQVSYKFAAESDTSFRAAVFEDSQAKDPVVFSKSFEVVSVDAKTPIAKFINDFNAAWERGSKAGVAFITDNVYPGLYDTNSQSWKVDSENISNDPIARYNLTPKWETLKTDINYVPEDTFCSAHQTSPLPGLNLTMKVDRWVEDSYNVGGVSWEADQEFVLLNGQVKIYSFAQCSMAGGD